MIKPFSMSARIWMNLSLLILGCLATLTYGVYWGRSFEDQLFRVSILLVPSGIIVTLILFSYLINRSINRRLKKTIILEKSVEQAVEGIAVTDMAGTLIFNNYAWAVMHGYEIDELIGKNMFELCGMIDLSPDKRLSRKFASVEGEHPKKDGTFFPVMRSTHLIEDEQGEFLCIMVRDISARRLAEEALKKAHDELELRVAERTRELLIAKLEAEKASEQAKRAMDAAEKANKAKSEFLANMSHEIRTPLNGIIGMTEIAGQTNLDENQRNIFNLIDAEAVALLGIINDILDYSKIEAGMMEIEEIPFDLRTLMEDVAGGTSVRAAQKGIEFILFLPLGIPTHLIGDPGRLRQILVNLTGNSVKFTHQGEIIVRVETLISSESHVTLKFIVQDTGIGIPRDKQDVIFKSFTQVDGSTTRKYGGTGLGTTICKKLVELMGGEICFSSEEHKGTTFVFSLSFRTQDIQETEIPEDHVDISGLNVLVVDDISLNRDIIMEYLKSWACRTVEAESALSAINKLNTSMTEEKFDLLITDLQMADMDGFELARTIRGMTYYKELPIIVLTSVGLLGDGRSCREIGVNAYLTKPVKSGELKRVIESTIGSIETEKTETRPGLITRHTLIEKQQKHRRILLVEDYPTNQQVTMRNLMAAGYDAELAENGLEAVNLFRKKRFDLILMDMQMPVMDGYEAIGKIREIESKYNVDEPSEPPTVIRIPIVAVTAHAMKGDQEKCIDAGADDYLTKPLRKSKLLAVIEKWTKNRKPEKEMLAAFQEEPRGSAESPKEASAPPPVVYEKILEEFDDDQAFLSEIIKGFLKNVKVQLTAIAAAIQKKDGETIRKEAHAIKGGAANLMAIDLSKAASALETLAKSGSLDQSDLLLESLEKEFVRFENYVITKL